MEAHLLRSLQTVCLSLHPPFFITFSNLFFSFTPCSLPCDVSGDISYEELRAMAYEEAKRGVPLQSIVRF